MYRVTLAKKFITGKSCVYPMIRPIRGECVILNNVRKIAYSESLLFKNVFEQLHFNTKG